VTSNNRWITTVAARFGVTNGNWLFYGKAGGGWIGNEDFTVTNLRTGSSFNISNDSSNGGWLVGAGIEWAFAANWSAKVEYNYLGLEDRTFVVPAGSPFFPGDTFTRGNRNIQMVKGGSTTGSIGAATATDLRLQDHAAGARSLRRPSRPSVGLAVALPSYMVRMGILCQRRDFVPRRQNWFRSALPWVSSLATLHRNEKQA
jgi:opacity protein-like surface antigen